MLKATHHGSLLIPLKTHPNAARLLVLAVALLLGLAASACQPEPGGNFTVNLYTGQADLGDDEVTLSDVIEEGKPVVLNFWAGQCPPCRAEMPVLQDAYKEYQDDVVFLGVDVGPFVGLGSFEDGVALLEEMGISYPSGSAASHQVVPDWRLDFMPSTYFLDAAGRVQSKWIGGITATQLNQEITGIFKGSE
ncbi:MAG: TlpA disulfide reductase family protein [Dehalococcoidia bacterium]